ncbi:hypothetical protein Plhal304r1_c056g0141631 [Plasmopara halstedii]
MIAEHSMSRRLCFLLLSCVAVSIYSEVAQLEAMMMSNEQTIAQRHDRALTSTPDQMSTSLEERGAPVAVEEEAGMLSRFVSYFKPSNLWKKLASSWIMRFFMPHIYLRHSSNIESAGNKLFIKVHADKVKDLFNSQEFQKWLKYFTDAFPDNPKNAASYMVSILASKHEVQLFESIPKTKVVDGRLVLGDKKSELLADRLEESLLKLIKRLKADDSSKIIRERLEIGVRGDGISKNKERLVKVDNVRPVQKLSSQQKVINKPVISLTSGLNYKEADAFLLLKSVGLDKVETDIFNSDQFQMWLKRITTIFDSPAIMADVMLTTLVKFDIIKVVASIPTTKFKDDKLAFGDHFKEALMDFIANGADVEYVEDSYKNLEKSVLDPINVLKSGEHSSFGEILEGEYLFTQLNKNKEGLFDIFDDSSVQKWYRSMDSKDKNEALSVIDRRLELQKINSKRIGEVIHQNRDNYTKKVMNDLVLYKLQSLFTVHTFEGSLAEYHLFQGWIREAFHLDAKVTSVLSILRTGLSEKWIIQFCNYLIFNDVELSDYARTIELATIENLKSGLDNELLDKFELTWFSFLHPMARSWMTYMTIQHKQNACSVMSKVLRSKYKSQIPRLIEEGKQSGYAPLAIKLEEDLTMTD